MAYLLTNGLKTNNLNTYLKDILYLNFKLLPTEVPFNQNGLGIDRLQTSESVLDYKDKVREVVTSLLSRLNERHSVNMNLSNLEVTNSDILITINVNNSDTDVYSIPIMN